MSMGRIKPRFMDSTEASRAQISPTDSSKPPAGTWPNNSSNSKADSLMQSASNRLSDLANLKNVKREREKGRHAVQTRSGLKISSPFGFHKLDNTSSTSVSSTKQQSCASSHPVVCTSASPMEKPLPSLPIATITSPTPVNHRSLMDALEKPLRRSLSPLQSEDWPAISPEKHNSAVMYGQSSREAEGIIDESVTESIARLRLDDCCNDHTAKCHKPADSTQAIYNSKPTLSSQATSSGHEAVGSGCNPATESTSGEISPTLLAYLKAKYENCHYQPQPKQPEINKRLSSTSLEVPGSKKVRRSRYEPGIERPKAHNPIQTDYQKPRVSRSLEELVTPSKSSLGASIKGSSYALVPDINFPGAIRRHAPLRKHTENIIVVGNKADSTVRGTTMKRNDFVTRNPRESSTLLPSQVTDGSYTASKRAKTPMAQSMKDTTKVQDFHHISGSDMKSDHHGGPPSANKPSESGADDNASLSDIDAKITSAERMSAIVDKSTMQSEDDDAKEDQSCHMGPLLGESTTIDLKSKHEPPRQPQPKPEHKPIEHFIQKCPQGPHPTYGPRLRISESASSVLLGCEPTSFTKHEGRNSVISNAGDQDQLRTSVVLKEHWRRSNKILMDHLSRTRNVDVCTPTKPAKEDLKMGSTGKLGQPASPTSIRFTQSPKGTNITGPNSQPVNTPSALSTDMQHTTRQSAWESKDPDSKTRPANKGQISRDGDGNTYSAIEAVDIKHVGETNSKTTETRDIEPGRGESEATASIVKRKPLTAYSTFHNNGQFATTRHIDPNLSSEASLRFADTTKATNLHSMPTQLPSSVNASTPRGLPKVFEYKPVTATQPRYMRSFTKTAHNSRHENDGMKQPLSSPVSVSGNLSSGRGMISNIRGLFHKRSSEQLNLTTKVHQGLRAGKAPLQSQALPTALPARVSRVPRSPQVKNTTPSWGPRLAKPHRSRDLYSCDTSAQSSVPHSPASTFGKNINRLSTEPFPCVEASNTAETDAIDEATRLVYGILDAATAETRTSRKADLVELSKAMVQVINRARDAERSVEEAKQAAARAEMAFVRISRETGDVARVVRRLIDEDNKE